jgi:alkanesulfonate monooxygenase SsuD/methylene tetrahydromethanopterin reductase-like flavin-dependent oxidoreductase (luciferase family)
MHPVELAQEAEARGFHSLYIPDTPISLPAGGPPHPLAHPNSVKNICIAPTPISRSLPRAPSQKKILLGTGIGLPAQHDPITFAKELATLDWMTKGRFIFGIGYGWNHEEMGNRNLKPRFQHHRY